VFCLEFNLRLRWKRSLVELNGKFEGNYCHEMMNLLMRSYSEVCLVLVYLLWLLGLDGFNVIFYVEFCEGWSVSTLVSNGNRRALQF